MKNTSDSPSSPLLRLAGLGYAVTAYLGFFASFGYFILRTMGYVDRWNLGAGLSLPPAAAAALNVALIGAFAVQHSVMARPWFKRLITRVVPQPLERATYVWASNVALTLASYFWASSPAQTWSLWQIENPVVDWTLWGLGLLGWLGVAGASFLIDHFELFGLRQAFCWATRRPFVGKEFRTPGAYRVVRHPMMLGMLVGLWCSGEMSVMRLSLSGLMTAYVFFGMRLEERDLVALFGQRYLRYAERVPQVIPRLFRTSKDDHAASDTAPLSGQLG